MNKHQFEPPPAGFTVTHRWQVMPDNIRKWYSPIWSAVAFTSSRLCVLFGDTKATVWRTRGRGAKSKFSFVHIKTSHATFIIKHTTGEIRILL